MQFKILMSITGCGNMHKMWRYRCMGPKVNKYSYHANLFKEYFFCKISRFNVVTQYYYFVIYFTLFLFIILKELFLFSNSNNTNVLQKDILQF